MRPRRASASNGIVYRRVRLSHQTILIGAIAVVGLWMVGSLIQEISINQSLSSQAAELRDQNAALRATNDGYRRDITAVSSGAAAEEEARKDGYARSDEKLYVIATPPPSAATTNVAARSRSGGSGPLDAIWRFLTNGHGS
jgi:cell division protein FtsB